MEQKPLIFETPDEFFKRSYWTDYHVLVWTSANNVEIWDVAKAREYVEKLMMIYGG